MEVRQIKISSFLAKYLSFNWSPISGTQGVKLPNLTLLKQTGNKQAISAFHMSQTAPIKTRSHFWPREQSEWKKKMNTFKTENSSAL